MKFTTLTLVVASLSFVSLAQADEGMFMPQPMSTMSRAAVQAEAAHATVHTDADYPSAADDARQAMVPSVTTRAQVRAEARAYDRSRQSGAERLGFVGGR